jgi:ankyrin repeat protein
MNHSFQNRLRFGAAALAVMIGSHVALCGPIHDAVLKGDVEKVKSLLKDHPELASAKDTTKAVENTPLQLASKKGSKEMLELLLANDADVNARDAFGRTALINAVIAGQKEGVELLIAHHADLNSQDMDGFSALNFASLAGHKEIVALLLANKAEVGNKDKKIRFGMTPLHSAAVGGNKDVAELLLANHADINALSNEGETPIKTMISAEAFLQESFSNSVQNAKSPEQKKAIQADFDKQHEANKAMIEFLRQHGGHE